MYRRLFDLVKRRIPRISDTELIALTSGNTSIDRDILLGKVVIPTFSQKENKLSDSSVNKFLSEYDHNRIYPNTNKNYWINKLGVNKYFSFLIDEKYGGVKLSVNELSNVLTKISSVDPALGVVAMVPNSLGPGELLSHYGTEKQKSYFLPKLANGTYIPCFGLTGPNNGSDATGSIDEGVVFKENGKVKIAVELNKRYITLSPVANLMGIAFRLNDPENLINKSGISVALVKREHEGLIQDTHHNPLDVGFPNGTIKGKIIITPDDIIGGEEMIGNGWKMLMECLSAGRGITLPATANASSKVAAFGIHHYINIRNQFKMPLSNMQAIQEKTNTIFYNTWIIQSAVNLTNKILDSGKTPSVISAIMKQQTTERGRIVLNEAMDIHAGAAICKGRSNFLEKFYKGVPIGITVEGSNTLTRSLIIFGQGLNKSHPYIFPVLDSVLNDSLSDFKSSFSSLVKHVIKCYFGSLSFEKSLNQQVKNFACLTNFVAVKGGALKREQMLSGDMADVFSNLYLAHAVLDFNREFNESEILTKYIVKRLEIENQLKINKIIQNLTWEKIFLRHLVREPKVMSYNEEEQVFNEIMNNKKIIDSVEKNIFIENSILEDMKMVLKNGGPEQLVNQIINVGEFKN